MWAPLVGPERQESETLRQVGYDRLAPSLGDVADVAFGEVAEEYSPVGALARIGRMEWAERTGTAITAQQFRDSGDFRQGLSWYEGMTAESARVLAERHDRRAKRDDILARDPGGIGRSTVSGAAALLAGAADPLGIAAGFVPVVGQVRTARLMAQLGRFGGRATVGAVEGAVGNALLEPLVYGAAQRDQLDYGMVDSLVNVAMGGLFGAGIRAGGGAVADLIARRGADRHTAAMDAAIRQAAAGQEVDVLPVLKAGDEVSGGASRRREDAAPASAALEARQAADRAAVAQGREQIRRGLEEDAARPRTFEQRRAEADAFLAERFPTREIPLATGGVVRRGGPMDLVSWLRTQGGVQDQAGELGDARLWNRGRDVPFAKGEVFLGRLVSDKGMTLEVAARRAAEAGYIGRRTMEDGALAGRGVVFESDADELVDAIDRTLRGERVWAEADAQAIRDHEVWVRGIDEEEALQPPRPERWEPLDDDGGMIDDPDAGMAWDDPEALWREELERSGQVEAGAMAEVEERAAGLGRAYEAAAACIARAL